MTVRLLCTQIPQYWEHIKYALAQVERFGSEDESLGAYNRVFASLLNDKSQCLMVQHEDRTLKALLITEILEDFITNKRVLNVRCAYGFKLMHNDEWRDVFECLKKLTLEFKCYKIIFQTSNARIENVGKFLGFKQRSVNMEIEV